MIYLLYISSCSSCNLPQLFGWADLGGKPAAALSLRLLSSPCSPLLSTQSCWTIWNNIVNCALTLYDLTSRVNCNLHLMIPCNDKLILKTLNISSSMPVEAYRFHISKSSWTAIATRIVWSTSISTWRQKNYLRYKRPVKNKKTGLPSLKTHQNSCHRRLHHHHLQSCSSLGQS